MANFEKLLIIGCGNMGGAMLAGWLSAGLDPARFAILDPVLEAAPDGVALFRTANEAQQLANHDCVMLGFKPQQLGDLSVDLQQLINDSVSVFSLLGGVDLATVQNAFPKAGAHIRVMPNLAARLGKSPIILCSKNLADAQDKETARLLFDHLGSAFWLEDEAQFDLVTALAGSGPGFVYRFIDALGGAAEELGLDSELAQRLALATVEGASLLAAASDDSPAILADRVASPGGMTREGLNVLDEGGALQEILVKTLHKTAAKGGELARIARGDG